MIKYAHYLKNKSTKQRGGVPSAKILGGENDLFDECPRKSVFDEK